MSLSTAKSYKLILTGVCGGDQSGLFGMPKTSDALDWKLEEGVKEDELSS